MPKIEDGRSARRRRMQVRRERLKTPSIHSEKFGWQKF
jgi:hypothetical protein